MSENEAAAPAPEPQTPICPYCLTDPFQPQAIPFNTQNGVTLLKKLQSAAQLIGRPE